MKKILLVNYYLVMIGWCLFLNSYDTLAILFVLAGCAMLCLLKDNINFWRIMALSLAAYSIGYTFLIKTSIPNYFPSISYLLFAVSINSALSLEYLKLFNNYGLCIISGAFLSCILSACAILVMLPNYLYTIFTKTNLLLMILFIFLPYFLSAFLVLAINLVRYLQPTLLVNKHVKI